MWKMGSVERSAKSLINTKNTFYKKVSEESGAVFIFINGGSKKIGNGSLWARQPAENFHTNSQKILFHTNLSFPTYMVTHKPGLVRISNGGMSALKLWACPTVTLRKVVVKLKLFSAGRLLEEVVIPPFPT